MKMGGVRLLHFSSRPTYDAEYLKRLFLLREVDLCQTKDHATYAKLFDLYCTYLVAPPDLVLAYDGLHDGVEAALRCVQVARHLRALHLTLIEDRIKQRESIFSGCSSVTFVALDELKLSTFISVKKASAQRQKSKPWAENPAIKTSQPTQY